MPGTVIGIDQSLRHTGVFWIGEGILGWKQIDPVDTGAKRLAYIRDEVLKVVDEQKPVLAAIEGYAYGAVGKVFELGELGGILRLAMEDKSVPTIIVAPSQVKKFVTANHQAEKTDVIAAVNLHFKIDFHRRDDNLADAAALALVAQAYLNPDMLRLRHELEVIKALTQGPVKKKKKRVKRNHKFPNI